MKAFRAAAPFALAGLAACASGPSPQSADASNRVREIHDRVITIDTHDDIEGNFATDAINPCGPTNRQVDIPKMKAGGLDVGFFIVYVGQTARTDSGYVRAKAGAIQKFEAIHRMAEQLCPDQIEIAYSPDDVERIVKSGKRVAAIGIENGYVIGKDLSLIADYQKRGARYMTLAHNGNNDIAGSAQPNTNLGDPAETIGITPFGEQVIAELNRVGILVDVSHISKKAALDAMRLTKAPVIASHSGAWSINNHPRNMDDEALEALRRNGGVIQIVALGDFVKTMPPAKAQATQALREEFGLNTPPAQQAGGAAPAGGRAGGRAGGGRGGMAAALAALTPERRAEYDRKLAEIEKKWPVANIRDFVDHIDHAVKRIGIDHVGISSDFDGGGGIDGWRNAAETMNVTAELVRRGYTEEQIRKLWGGNTLRIWREAERIAKDLQRISSQP